MSPTKDNVKCIFSMGNHFIIEDLQLTVDFKRGRIGLIWLPTGIPINTRFTSLFFKS